MGCTRSRTSAIAKTRSVVDKVLRGQNRSLAFHQFPTWSTTSCMLTSIRAYSRGREDRPPPLVECLMNRILLTVPGWYCAFTRWMRLLKIFVVALNIALVLPASAQMTGKPLTRIGFMGNADPKTQAQSIAALRQGLRELGWIEGENLYTEYRWAEGNIDRLSGFAAELARLKVGVIVTAGTQGIRAAQSATSTIPIVFAVVLADPVELGFAKSLARPGGNTTGLASQYEEIITKHVQLLAETVPGISRMALLRHMSAPPIYEATASAAANKLGLKVQVLTVGEVGELEGAFKSVQANKAQGLLVLPSALLNAQRLAIIRLAAAYQLPAFYEFREFVEDGGLMSYGPSIPEMYRRAARYVDRVLKGTKPGDLPIERASHLSSRLI